MGRKLLKGFMAAARLLLLYSDSLSVNIQPLAQLRALQSDVLLKPRSTSYKAWTLVSSSLLLQRYNNVTRDRLTNLLYYSGHKLN